MNPPLFPTINASLNFCAFVFLITGWYWIKKDRRDLHQKCMIGALASSILFLMSYVSYHILVHGVTKYHKEGIWRVIYFFILGTHTPLAVIIVPFCLRAVYHAVKKDFQKHTRITKWLFPVWVYVSLTGVLIYLMLYIF